jgi:hypothetical protein
LDPQSSNTLQPLRQVLAPEQLHHQVQTPILGLSHIKHLHNMRALDHSRRTRFSLKTSDATLLVIGLRVDDFQRDTLA